MSFWNKNGTALFDGGMGSYYAEKFGHQPECCERANIEYPERVERIHREYINAGCDAIKTNTFGASRSGQDCDEETARSIRKSGFKLAQKAAEGTSVSVFADIGPIPHVENEDETAQYIDAADDYLALGAENFLLETFSSTQAPRMLAEYIKKRCPTAKIICSFAVAPDGFTREGVSAALIKAEMESDDNVDAFGFNCLSGPNHMVKLVRELGEFRKPLIAMPNAGYPTTVGSRTFYENNADYFAKMLAELAACGAGIIGGCCGTTPEHIAKARALLDIPSGGRKSYAVVKPAAAIEPTENRLWKKLESGKKLIAVELDPPANSDIRVFMNGARALRDAGADAITIADCPVSRARADSSLLAAKLKRELDIEPIPHMTCRDRNIIATKALLLGLNAEEVRNVLVVTGDPVPSSERGVIKSVFNFNSVVLTSFIKQLSQELCCGEFRVFGALNLNAVNFDVQLRHAQDKIKSGADGFLTQPVHSERALENLKTARRELDAKILGGVMPIVSHRNACFMNSEIAGISVSDEIVRRYEGLDKDQASELAVSLTTQIAQSMADYVDGYYMITPFSRTDLTCRIMDNIR